VHLAGVVFNPFAPGQFPLYTAHPAWHYATMKSRYLIPLLLVSAPAMADQWGQAVQVTGKMQQLAATTLSSSKTMSPASGNVIAAQNEGVNPAYATCSAPTADTPAGGTCATCAFIAPNGGGALLFKPNGSATCAAITSTGSDSIDFTPINIY